MFKRLLASPHLKRRARWILTLLAVSLVLPLVLFFHAAGSRSGPGRGGAAGELFGRPVPWETYQQTAQLIRQRFEEQVGGSIPMEFLEPMVRQQAWDRLMVTEHAQRTIRITKEELAHFIRTHPTFQRDGQFNAELYYRFIAASGLSPQLFEDRLRDDLRVQRLVESVHADVSVTEEDLRAAYSAAYDRLRAALVLIETAALAAQMQARVTEAEVRGYYDAYRESMRRPAQRTIEFLGLSQDEATDTAAAISEADTQTYYDEHQEAFLNADGTVRPLDEVAEVIRERLREEHAGRRLTTLSLDLEEDREAGRTLADIAAARGLTIRTIGPLEEGAGGLPNGPSGTTLRAAFEVPVGEMTEVLRDFSGIFLLRPVEELPSRILEFEEVRDQITQQLVALHAREAAMARANQIRDELVALRAGGRTFDEACGIVGVAPLRPAPFATHDPVAPLDAMPSVIEALSALTPGELSAVLETPQGFVMGLVEERLPFDEAQFAKDKDAFSKTVLESKQQERLAAWLAELRVQARLKSYMEEVGDTQ